MFRITILFTLSFYLATTAYAAEPILSAKSYGDIVFGKRLADVEIVLGEKAIPTDIHPSCDYVQFTSYPKARFMVEKGVLTRAEVEASVPNELNISIGTSFAEASKKQQMVQIERHNYDPEGYYLIFESTDGKNAVVMEVTEGKVVDIRAGIEPSVEYIEGCL